MVCLIAVPSTCYTYSVYILNQHYKDQLSAREACGFDDQKLAHVYRQADLDTITYMV